MFDIEREETLVKVRVKPSFPLHDHTFVFSWNAGTEWAAKLLLHNLTNKQGKELERVREEAYQQGWKDAKGHHTKKTWFSSRWS